MSLRAKMLSGFILTLVLFAGSSFVHFHHAHKTAVRLATVNELYLPLSRHTAQLQSAVQGLADDVRRYYFAANPTAADSTLARMVRDLYPYLIRKNFSAAEALLAKVPDAELSVLLAQAAANFDALSAATQQSEFEKAVMQLRGTLEGLATEVEKDSRIITLAAETQGRETLWLAVGAAGLLGVLGFGILRVSHHAQRSLPVLIENIRQMADGNFEKPIKVETGEEATQELARQYNRMLAALKERDKKIQQQQREILQSERLAAVGQLSAEIVHEIRNPLNSISLNIDWLQEEMGTTAPEISKTLGSISREVQRLHQLTENYLIRARFPVRSASRTPVNELIREIVDFTAEENRVQQIEVALELWPEEIYVQSERPRLKQALLNVLRNAREAMPRGGRVTVHTDVHQNVSRIRVADNGSGMNDSTRRQTFQPFFTTKPDGTGLGMMVTKSIVEEARGSVHCESNLGHGTTIHFQFPA